MKVNVDQEDRRLARQIHTEFAGKPGSQHIASRFALAHLSAILRRERPARVLEFGAGIGTVTALLLRHPAKVEEVVATEANRFCLDQLARNLEVDPRLAIIDRIEDGPGENEPFDLIIFDGIYTIRPGCGLYRRGSVLFVEGGREKTRQTIISALASDGMRCQFTSHEQPVRAIAIKRSKRRFLSVALPKITFGRADKGCWIGKVEERT